MLVCLIADVDFVLGTNICLELLNNHIGQVGGEQIFCQPIISE